jgi:dipeptidyl aminopeptidase/acylaminoacyl peptidase
LRLERFALAGIVASALVLAGCDRAPSHASLKPLDLPRLVPAREFVFNVERHGGFSFSPDGMRLAWTGPSGWRSALHVRIEAAGKTHVYRVGGSERHWSADGRRLLILDDKSGAENHRLYRLDIEDPDAELVDLTPFPGVRVWLHRIPKADPEHVLVLHNRRSHTLRDLYRINLSTGAEEIVALNPGDGIAPVTDEEGRFLDWRRAAPNDRARSKQLPPHLHERSALARKSPDVAQPVAISDDRTQAWVLTNRGRDRVGLFHLQADGGGAAQVLHEDVRVDIDRVRVSEVTRRPLLAVSVPDYPRMDVFDERLASDLAPLLAPYANVRHGYDVVSSSPDESRVVVVVYTHANRRYYLLDRTTRRSSLLGESRSADFQANMVVPEPVEYRASDGLRIPAYLLRPRNARGGPLPLVMLVHGGPWQRVAWTDLDHGEDMLRAQFLANRGYAVLVANYRGSTGYGRNHMTAAVGQFGKAMQQDLVDGARWAIERGIADPARIAIAGHSYGGYATLMGLAQQPQMFACGIAIAGPTDLPRLIETFPPYWELELSYWYSYVGDPAVPVDRARMTAMSPITLAPDIRRPVLVIQGGTDVRVLPEQSRSLVARLREHDRPVEYLELPEMGHSLGYWAHHLVTLRRIEEFLAPCLGGRSARFDALEWIARLTGRLPLW